MCSPIRFSGHLFQIEKKDLLEVNKMVAKKFEIGDLVWAKMKGYPAWPGKISVPPAEASVKKCQHYVFFYGSENYAWILDENIELHNQKMVVKYTQNQKRPTVYLNAVDELVNASKGSLKYMEDSESSLEESFIKEKEKDNRKILVAKKRVSGDKKRTAENTSGERSKVSVERGKKKVSIEKLSVKKDLKRISSDGTSGKDFGIPSKSQRTNDDYLELRRNCPPNYTYSSESFDNENETALKIGQETSSEDSGNEFSKSKKIVPTKKKIGFLGLGRVGQGIVKNLLETGHSVMIWNRTVSKCDMFDGAERGNMPADVVMACDITFSCMADPEVSKQIASEIFEVKDGFDVALSAASTGEKKGFVELTSLDPDTSHSIYQAVTGKGGRYLEAQLSGTRSHALEGNLFILTAGDKSLFNDCESCFCAMGKSTLYLGADAGVACKFSIVHNMLLGTTYAAMAESLALIEPIGIAASDFLDILSNGAIHNQDILDKGYSMLQKHTPNNTPLQHIQKNISFGLALGSRVEQPMPVAAATNEAYKHCKLLKYAEKDVSVIFKGTKR